MIPQTMFRALALVILPLFFPPSPAGAGADVVSGLVVHVFDGDTILVNTGRRKEKVRLLGVDTPETDGPYTKLEPYGNVAGARTRELTLGKHITLEFGGSTKRDKYKRLLAYVTLRDGRVLNEILLREGLARAYRRFRHKNKLKYMTMERRAKDECRGMWKLKRPCSSKKQNVP